MRKFYYLFFLLGMLVLCLIGCKTDQASSENTPPPVPTTGNPTVDALTAQIIKNPDNAQLYATRAAAYYEAEGYDEAIADMAKAMSIDSTNVDYHHLLADIYLDYYQSRLALKTMERAAALHPDRIPTLLKLSEFQFILKQYNPSLKTIDQILQLDPQLGEAYFMMGRNFWEIGDTDRAIASFQKAVDFEPELIDGWIMLGKLFSEKENPVALRFYDNALAIDSTYIDAYFGKARYLHQQGQLTEAIAQYKKVNQFNPQMEDAHYNAGLAWFEMDSTDQAYQKFDLAVKVAPAFVMAYYYRGLTAEIRGDLAAAKNDYQQALNLQPDFDRAQKALNKLNN